jgi:hypothetical protein
VEVAHLNCREGLLLRELAPAAAAFAARVRAAGLQLAAAPGP